MTDEKMEKKKREEIQERKRYAIRHLAKVEELILQLEKEKNEKKREKIFKKIEESKQDSYRRVNRFVEVGGKMDDLVQSLSSVQVATLEELFPEGTDSQSIEMKKETQRYKKQIEKIKEAAKKDGYEDDWPFEKKRKTWFYRHQYLLFMKLRDCSDTEHEDYVEIWNYKKDYESTKDKYFTPEEQKVIEGCLKIGAEEKAWYQENYKWRIELGKKLCDTAAKIEEWGDLTAAKIVIKGMKEDFFPNMLKEFEKDISQTEIDKRSFELTRGYILFCRDEEAVTKAYLQIKEIEESVPEPLGKEDRQAVILDAMIKQLGLEKTLYVLVHETERAAGGTPLGEYDFTLEELGL